MTLEAHVPAAVKAAGGWITAAVGGWAAGIPTDLLITALSTAGGVLVAFITASSLRRSRRADTVDRITAAADRMLDRSSRERDEIEAERDAVQHERDILRSERDALRSEIHRLTVEIQRLSGLIEEAIRQGFAIPDGDTG